MMIVGALGLAANLVVMQLLRAGSRRASTSRAPTSRSSRTPQDRRRDHRDLGPRSPAAIEVGHRRCRRDRDLRRRPSRHPGPRGSDCPGPARAPAGVDPAQVEEQLAALPGVSDVHGLHLWTLTSGMNVATAHLLSTPGARPRGRAGSGSGTAARRFRRRARHSAGGTHLRAVLRIELVTEHTTHPGESRNARRCGDAGERHDTGHR